jgi:hypothetical protein
MLIQQTPKLKQKAKEIADVEAKPPMAGFFITTGHETVRRVHQQSQTSQKKNRSGSRAPSCTSGYNGALSETYTELLRRYSRLELRSGAL